MKKPTSSLGVKGLSISQAQSISNLCNQRAIEISNCISDVNNMSKTVKVDGTEHQVLKARKMPENIVELLKEKAQLHACQAFLMENLKEKARLLDVAQSSKLDVLNMVKVPQIPTMIVADLKGLEDVNESWGWDRLSVAEYNEYLEAEAFASHIGQYIHKGGTLDRLRKDLPLIPDIEWMNIYDGIKTPVTIKTHHKSNELMKIHEELADMHRAYEQRVNYFKAKVKNLVTAENARLAKIRNDKTIIVKSENEKLLADYRLDLDLVQQEVTTLEQGFEVKRQEEIKEYAALRIGIDPRFQEVIDIFLKKLESDEK